MDTDSLYLALSEEDLEDILLPEKRNEWEAIRSRNCTDSFTANATDNFFTGTYYKAHKKHDNEKSRKYLKKNLGFPKYSKTFRCYDRKSNKYKFSSKGLIKGTLEDCGNGPMSKYRKGARRGSPRYFNQQTNNET